MSSQLTEFRIEGLHGRRSIRVPIRNGRLVLVGENGTGKSTLATILFYFLTGQWRRLAEYELVSVTGTFEDAEIRVDSEQLRLHSKQRHPSRRHRIPSSLQHHLLSLVRHASPDEVLEDRFLRTVASDIGVPVRIAEELVMEFLDGPEESLELEGVGRKLREIMDAQVLFLPTYRRIEQDMRSIFRGLDAEVERFRERLQKRVRGGAYVELVEFGMDDVDQAFVAKMGQLKDLAREGLNDLTGAYLRDVIRGIHHDVTFKGLESVFDANISAILGRLDVDILPEKEKEHLLDVIDDIRSARHIGDSEKVAAHFLSKLVELQERQTKNERDVRKFVRVCNDYLVGKQIHYDDQQFRIVVMDEEDPGEEIGGEVSLSMLSSGEKQIISLFSHLYFSGASRFFVIIDEPELSLSVPWQKRFLPDILASGRCSGLVAVTHSPFIFENPLDDAVHSLAEFWEVDDGLH